MYICSTQSMAFEHFFFSTSDNKRSLLPPNPPDFKADVPRIMQMMAIRRLLKSGKPKHGVGGGRGINANWQGPAFYVC